MDGAARSIKVVGVFTLVEIGSGKCGNNSHKFRSYIDSDLLPSRNISELLTMVKDWL
jgi:hypothetical protein